VYCSNIIIRYAALDTDMRKVAMVTPAQARTGATFKVLINPRCLRCRYYKVCVGRLRHGGKYRVIEVRGTAHLCPLIREKMKVVLVEDAPVVAVINAKTAVAGIRTRYEKITCGEMRCKYYRYCAGTLLEKGEKVKIVRVLQGVNCPLGKTLVLAEILPVSDDPSDKQIFKEPSNYLNP